MKEVAYDMIHLSAKQNKSLATAKQPKSEPPHPQIDIAGQTLTARAVGMKDTQKGLLLVSICSYHPFIFYVYGQLLPAIASATLTCSDAQEDHV